MNIVNPKNVLTPELLGEGVNTVHRNLLFILLYPSNNY